MLSCRFLHKTFSVASSRLLCSESSSVLVYMPSVNINNNNNNNNNNINNNNNSNDRCTLTKKHKQTPFPGIWWTLNSCNACSNGNYLRHFSTSRAALRSRDDDGDNDCENDDQQPRVVHRYPQDGRRQDKRVLSALPLEGQIAHFKNLQLELMNQNMIFIRGIPQNIHEDHLRFEVRTILQALDIKIGENNIKSCRRVDSQNVSKV